MQSENVIERLAELHELKNLALRQLSIDASAAFWAICGKLTGIRVLKIDKMVFQESLMENCDSISPSLVSFDVSDNEFSGTVLCSLFNLFTDEIPREFEIMLHASHLRYQSEDLSTLSNFKISGNYNEFCEVDWSDNPIPQNCIRFSLAFCSLKNDCECFVCEMW
jgi:hypothetical protein